MRDDSPVEKCTTRRTTARPDAAQLGRQVRPGSTVQLHARESADADGRVDLFEVRIDEDADLLHGEWQMGRDGGNLGDGDLARAGGKYESQGICAQRRRRGARLQGRCFRRF